MFDIAQIWYNRWSRDTRCNLLQSGQVVEGQRHSVKNSFDHQIIALF